MNEPVEENPADNRAAIGMSALITAGRFFHTRGWVPATSSNFSVKLDLNSMLVTVSGRHKGVLTPADFMRIDYRTEAPIDAGKKPSAEAGLHSLVYRLLGSVGCVLHTHSVNATVFSRRTSSVRFSDYELVKAFPRFETHKDGFELPVFPNDQDIPRLAGQVEAHLQANPDTVGYLIEGHGLYTWGDDVPEAVRHIEALEFLLECEYKRLTLSHLPV